MGSVTSNDIVPGMAEAIEARIRELGMSPTEFAAASGVTLAGLAPLRKGQRRAYQTRLKRPVCRALKWRWDSIDLLMAGKPPVPLDNGPEPEDDPLSLRLDDVEEAILDLQRQVADLARRTLDLPAEGRAAP